MFWCGAHKRKKGGGWTIGNAFFSFWQWQVQQSRQSTVSVPWGRGVGKFQWPALFGQPCPRGTSVVSFFHIHYILLRWAYLQNQTIIILKHNIMFLQNWVVLNKFDTYMVILSWSWFLSSSSCPPPIFQQLGLLHKGRLDQRPEEHRHHNVTQLAFFLLIPSCNISSQLTLHAKQVAILGQV